MTTKTIQIRINRDEQHPIAMLVQIANQFEASLKIIQKNHTINCKSIMGMLTLDMKKGETVEITGDGKDEEDAVQAIIEYLQEEA